MAYDESTIEVLKSDVRELRSRIDESRSHVDILYRAVARLQPSPEFPASELISIGTGPARVAMLDMGSTSSLETATNRRLAELEATGAMVEDVRFAHAMSDNGEAESYAVCIVFRLPAPATEAAP